MASDDRKHDRDSARRELAAKLIALAGNGAQHWERGWRVISRNRPLNGKSGRAYEGGNRLNLVLGTPWHSPGWLTRRQVGELGGVIRADFDRPTQVEFWKRDEFWRHKQTRVTLDGAPVSVLTADASGIRVRDAGGQEMVVPSSQVGSRIVVRPPNPDGFTRQSLSWDEAQQKLGRMIAHSYWVYNLEQIQGIDEARLSKKIRMDATAQREHDASGEDRSALVQDLMAGMSASGVKFVEAISNQPRYSPRADVIYMPKQAQFVSQDAFISTLLHEIAHSTGAGHRLGRFVGGVWGGEDDVDESEFQAQRAIEELRAEMCSAMLCSELGVTYNMSTTAAYLQSWMNSLQESEHVAYGAAKDAAVAADFVLSALESAKQARLTAEEGHGAVSDAEVSAQQDPLPSGAPEAVEQDAEQDDQTMVMGL